MRGRERKNTMTTLQINGKEYKIKFGYNSFCDSDIMERVSDAISLFSANEVKSDEDVSAMGGIKELFCLVRELMFIGFQKFNPAESLQEVGNLLDDYMEEAEDGEDRGLFALFTQLSEELMSEGFFGDLLKKMSENQTTEKPKKNGKK